MSYTIDLTISYMLFIHRSPLSDKAFNKDHSRMNRVHLGSFRSRFNRFTLDNSSTTPVSTVPAGRLSPTHHATAGRHTHGGRLWSSENSSRERYNDWKRSMDRWESAIRTQYATLDSWWNHAVTVKMLSFCNTTHHHFVDTLLHHWTLPM